MTRDATVRRRARPNRCAGTARPSLGVGEAEPLLRQASAKYLVLGDQVRDGVGLALLHVSGNPDAPQTQHREIHN